MPGPPAARALSIDEQESESAASPRLHRTLPLSALLASLQEKLAALETWSLRMQEQETGGRPAAVALAPRAEATQADPSTVQRAHDALVAAHRHAAALIEDARQVAERRTVEAREAADAIRLAADVAADRALSITEDTNRFHVQSAESQARQVLAFAEARVAQVLGHVPALDVMGEAARAQAQGGRPEVTAPVRMSPPPPPSTAARAPAPEPLPVVREAPEPSAEAAGGAVPGGLELVVGPFSRFSQLARFISALRDLPGIESVATRQFFKGIVYLRVRYDSPVPLVTRLLELRTFQPSVTASAPTRIELRVEAPPAVPTEA